MDTTFRYFEFLLDISDYVYQQNIRLFRIILESCTNTTANIISGLVEVKYSKEPTRPRYIVTSTEILPSSLSSLFDELIRVAFVEHVYMAKFFINFFGYFTLLTKIPDSICSTCRPRKNVNFLSYSSQIFPALT